MGCLPESGGCEHRFVQPFVDHLNAIEQSAFRHTACLDVQFRDTPQPEALYTDQVTSQQMAIERKCLVWPLDYASRHQNDHELADRLYAQLPQWATNGPYTIKLPSLLRAGRPGIDALATEICSTIAERGPLGGGAAIRGAGSHDWVFRPRTVLDDDEAPGNRLLVIWDLVPDHGMPPWPQPRELAKEFERLLKSAARKFVRYENHRCVLLLEPHGAVAHTPLEWWQSLLSDLGAPPVKELWIAEEDPADPDGQPYWSFDRLYPPSDASAGCA